jgi:RHS repeat-associated protein
MGSTLAIIDAAANLIERVDYYPYGGARHHYMADITGDGAVETTADINGIRGIANGTNHAIGQSNYNADADINRDGDVTLADYNLANGEGTHAALAKGLLSNSTVDNTIGWNGYVFNPELPLYTVRHRHYDPLLGRWQTRDPAGYSDGMNLFQNVNGNPNTLTDPMGLGLFSWLYAGDWNATDEEYRAAIGAFQDSSRGRVERKLYAIHSTTQELSVLTQARLGMITYEEAQTRSGLMQSTAAIVSASPSASTSDVALIMAGGSMAAYGQDVSRIAEGVCEGDAEAIGDAADKVGEALLTAASLKTGYLPEAKSFQLLQGSAAATCKCAVAGEGAGLRARVLENIAASKAARSSSNFGVLVAKEAQLAGGYAPDALSMTLVPQGSIVYGGIPGQSAWYTDAATVVASGGSRTTLFRSIQVAPSIRSGGYRPAVGVYQVMADIRVPAGVTVANPRLGAGVGINSS